MTGYTKGILATIKVIMLAFQWNMFQRGVSGLINTNRGFFKASVIHSEQANYLGHQVGRVEKFKKAAPQAFFP